MLDTILRRSNSGPHQAPVTHSSPPFSNGPAACANAGCNGSWTAFLKDRRRPLFEGDWACSSLCVSALVAAAIHREVRQASADQAEPHRHRFPLGLVLLAKGWITYAQLQHALEAQQRTTARRIGQCLIEECGAAPEHIARALGVQWGCPLLTMEGFDPHTTVRTMPILLMETLGIAPLRIARDRTLYLGCVGQPDPVAALAIQRMIGLSVVCGLIDPKQLSLAHQALRACPRIEAVLEQVPSLDVLPKRIASAILTAQPRASRLVRVHQFFWLRMWLEAGTMSTPAGGVPFTREDVIDHVYTIGAEL